MTDRVPSKGMIGVWVILADKDREWALPLETVNSIIPNRHQNPMRGNPIENDFR